MNLGFLYETRPETPDPHLPGDIYAEMESLEAIQQLVLRFEALGHSVRLINVLDDPWGTLVRMREELDLVYNYSVGFGSRSREIYAATVCEYLAVPYTGSDPLTLALAADKLISKLVARVENIRTAPFGVVRTLDQPVRIPRAWSHCIVKPLYEGSSIGVTGPLPLDDLAAVTAAIRQTVEAYRQGVLVEEFIPGYEVTVPVLGTERPRALAPVGMELHGEMMLGMRTFGGELKADPEAVTWSTKLPFPPQTIRALRRWATRIHAALGCRDLSRSDFRVTADGRPYYLETNATPQMTPEGGTFCCAAEAEGLSFEDVLAQVLESAMKRSRPLTPRTIPR